MGAIRLLRIWLLILATILTGCITPCGKDLQNCELPGEVYVQAGDLRIRKMVFSQQDFKEENIVMQKYDYSCGAAALTTLTKYYFGDNFTEQEVLRTIFTRLAKQPNAEATIKDRYENGLSMLDLFRASEDMGYQAAVVNIPLTKLAESQAPVIVRIEKDSYKHFVVFRGIVEDRVFLADPIRGNLRLSVAEFNKQWTLANDKHVKHSGEDAPRPVLFLGKAGFGLPKDHPLAIRQWPPVRIEMQNARQALFHAP